MADAGERNVDPVEVAWHLVRTTAEGGYVGHERADTNLRRSLDIVERELNARTPPAPDPDRAVEALSREDVQLAAELAEVAADTWQRRVDRSRGDEDFAKRKVDEYRAATKRFRTALRDTHPTREGPSAN